MTGGNVLFFGDNLKILRKPEYFPADSVDLIYLDPPFSSGKTYNVLFTERNGKPSGAQTEAFTDTWHWDMAAAEAFDDAVRNGGPRVAAAMDAFQKLLGQSDMMAYLAMMAPRLVELHRVLRETGAIYLHCDPTASSHLRLLLDSVFGPGNFRNEIIWRYKKYQKAQMHYFTSNTDRLLFYVKSESADRKFTPQFVKLDEPKRFLRRVWDRDSGRIVNAKDSRGKVQYMTVDREKVDDVWELPYLMPAAQERLGYPTQKPESLLRRVISSSSVEGDTVLDPFCGCGTTIAVAEELHRRWLGIDITYLAIGLVERRLKTKFPDNPPIWSVIGQPTKVSEATELAARDRYQFQWWVLDRLNAWTRDNLKKKGADQGIDGIINFQESPGSPVRTILIQVKSGGVHRGDVATLSGDMTREGAVIGALVTLEEPTGPMRKEAASAGFWAPSDPLGTGRASYPKIQLLSVEDIVERHRGIEYPEKGNVTFREAPAAARAARGRMKPLAERPSEAEEGAPPDSEQGDSDEP